MLRTCFVFPIILAILLGLPAFVGADDFFVEAKSDAAKEKETAEAMAALPAFSDLVNKISASVVSISSEADDNKAEEGDAPIPNFPFFKKDPNQPAKALGSGFIVNKEGYIVTNFHVVENSDKVIVRLLDDKTEYKAKVIGSDAKTDLALIKIDTSKELQPMHLGNSDKLKVGEWVVAIGNQFQLGQTVTAGIVSAKSRRVPTRISGPYDDFIQTDASINPGSSGGPLVNIHGHVIGINSAIFSPGRQQYGGTGFNIGIGFSIPINMAKKIIRQLREGGKVTRGLLGVIIQNINNDMAQALGLSEPYGALVSDVMDKSPAKAAGFERGDIIVAYNGKRVNEHDDLPLMVAETKIGLVAKVDILRDGQALTLKPKIGEMSDFEAKTKDEKKDSKPDKLGVVARKLSPEISLSLRQPELLGVIVLSVEPRSTAEKGGLMRGDVIEEMAGKRISSMDVYKGIVKSLKKGKPIMVLVRRKEGTRFLTLKVK